MEANYKSLTNEDVQVLKAICMSVWRQYDNKYGYVTEKEEVIKAMSDYPENAMYLLGMFDLPNTEKAFIETLKLYREEYVSPELLKFVGDTYSQLSIQWAELVTKLDR